MKRLISMFASLLSVGVLSTAMLAQPAAAARYDGAIQTRVTQKLAAKNQFQNVKASTEDGIVTLTGHVALYQQKLDAAKQARKVSNVQGVRNFLTVEGASVSDTALTSRLDRKLYYDRIGYANEFSFITSSVKDGLVTLSGEARVPVDLDSALSIVDNTPGVKDVVNNVTVLPVSSFDDSIRLRTARAIYRDPVLGRYASNPARPIRIVVENGHVSLYGVVENKMDKTLAGIRANQVPGVFSVQNHLQVDNNS